MFNKKYLILMIHLLILATLKANNPKQSNDFGTDCLIHNDQYQFEYLYSPNKNTSLVRLIPLDKVDDFNKLRWSLIEIDDHQSNGQFYLKSSYFDDYICATNMFADFLGLRRKVMRVRLKKDDLLDNNCKWILKKKSSITLDNKYIITNVLFDQSLYAYSYFFKRNIFQREVYLWHKKNAKSKTMKWMIDCQTGKHLWI